MKVKVKTKKPVEYVTLRMTPREAGELKHLLMRKVAWWKDSGGSTAREVYNALGRAGIQEILNGKAYSR